MYSSLEFLGERILRHQKANQRWSMLKSGNKQKADRVSRWQQKRRPVSFVLNLQKTLRSTGSDQCLGAERDRFREEHCRQLGHDPSQWFLLELVW